VKITGLAILSLLLPENTPRGDEYKDGRVMNVAFPSRAASTCSASRSIRPARPSSAAACACRAPPRRPARLAELYFRWTDGHLPSKFDSIQPAVTQQAPHEALGIRRVAPKRTSDIVLLAFAHLLPSPSRCAASLSRKRERGFSNV
jgi:hypothetical protein